MKHISIRLYFLLFLGLLFLNTGMALPQEAEINYISGNTIYINAGKEQGLAIGDTLEVRENGAVIARLLVKFVARHSASCTVIFQQKPLVRGMRVFWQKAEQLETTKVDTVQRSPAQEARKKESAAERKIVFPRTSEKGTRFRGYFAVQYYQWDDRSPANLDFNQPTIRLRLQASNLWNRGLDLRIYTRSRYNQRARRFSEDIPRTEWRNRVYELSLSYLDPGALLNYRFGRIISNQLSGIGYLDGGMLQMNLWAPFSVGVFAGTQPQWQYSSFQTDIQKYGAFLTVSSPSTAKLSLTTTLAAAGEYHGQEISREFFYFQVRGNYGSRIFIYQSAELDINRAWRKERVGESYSVSNLFTGLNWRISNRVNLGITYDSRKNYWTYETRSIADSLFDDLLRQGLRGSLSLRLPSNFFLYLNGGYRNRESDPEPTLSYGLNLNKGNFIARGMNVGINFNGFSGYLSEGENMSMRVNYYLLAGRVNLGVLVGQYAYRLKNTRLSRENSWVRLQARVPLIQKVYLASSFEWDDGEDVKGNRWFLELGYRF